MPNPIAPVAVFDSGIGGMSLLPHLWRECPTEHFLYLADQAHVPYGPRSEAEIQQLCVGATQYFLEHKAKLIVLACNTASGAALTYLRQTFPHLPFVGMEPAVKPAADQTRTGQVGVLATAGTFESQRYADLISRYAHHVTLLQDPCVGLVTQIEAGALDSPETVAILQRALTPMLAAGVDTLVLGCTHYPLVLPLIRRLVGDKMNIIDPASAVARQTRRVLVARGEVAAALQPTAPRLQLVTSADPVRMAEQLLPFWPEALPVQGVRWQDGRLGPAK